MYLFGLTQERNSDLFLYFPIAFLVTMIEHFLFVRVSPTTKRQISMSLIFSALLGNSPEWRPTRKTYCAERPFDPSYEVTTILGVFSSGSLAKSTVGFSSDHILASARIPSRSEAGITSASARPSSCALRRKVWATASSALASIIRHPSFEF